MVFHWSLTATDAMLMQDSAGELPISLSWADNPAVIYRNIPFSIKSVIQQRGLWELFFFQIHNWKEMISCQTLSRYCQFLAKCMHEIYKECCRWFHWPIHGILYNIACMWVPLWVAELSNVPNFTVQSCQKLIIRGSNLLFILITVCLSAPYPCSRGSPKGKPSNTCITLGFSSKSSEHAMI